MTNIQTYLEGEKRLYQEFGKLDTLPKLLSEKSSDWKSLRKGRKYLRFIIGKNHYLFEESTERAYWAWKNHGKGEFPRDKETKEVLSLSIGDYSRCRGDFLHFEDTLHYTRHGNKYLDLEEPLIIFNQPALVLYNKGRKEDEKVYKGPTEEFKDGFIPLSDAKIQEIVAGILQCPIKKIDASLEDISDGMAHGVLSGNIILFEQRATLVTDLGAIKAFLNNLEEVLTSIK